MSMEGTGYAPKGAVVRDGGGKIEGNLRFECDVVEHIKIGKHQDFVPDFFLYSFDGLLRNLFWRSCSQCGHRGDDGRNKQRSNSLCS